MYEDNQMYVKLSGGLTQPFKTTIGVKQGCVLSPLIFNLFINDLPEQYDDHCDPVVVKGQKLQALMFADDVLVLSQSSSGLKRAIKITVDFFHDLNLAVNFDKTQVMIFNARGVLLDKEPGHQFQVHGQALKLVREYTYLGTKLTPSGAASHGAEELFMKARRSWFSISNMIYKHKRMSTDKALQIFDQLVTSIGLFNCESWLPLVITKKSFSNQNSTLAYWESFQLETLNQKICRMILGVHRKSSRLATLGELDRFPLYVEGLCQVLRYQAQLYKSEGNGTIIVGHVVKDMRLPNPNSNTWWGRIEAIKQNLGVKYSVHSKLDLIVNCLKKQIRGKCEKYWLTEINRVKLGPTWIWYQIGPSALT